MIVVPTDNRIWLYGPAMDDVESELVLSEEFEQLVPLRDYMRKMLKKHRAIGLAAPQVGVFKQVFIFETASGEIVNLVNPEITLMRGKEVFAMEACLSVPPLNNQCPVPRMQNITVEHSTVEEPGRVRDSVLKGRDAVVAQHEIDHLTGTFFFDRVSSGYRINVLDRFNKWKRENLVHAKADSPSKLTTYSL